MSKKPQPQNKEPQKNKLQIVDQQNQPYLKALQRKVRNINKKLTQISELQNKDNLKQEQIEKISRKENLLQERTKLEQTATFYKQTLVENIVFYRNVQLKELEVLARALAIYHSGRKVAESEKLANLWRAVQQSDKSYNTLNETIAAISSQLKDFANDKKIQKNLATYVEEHGEQNHGNSNDNHEKIVNDILEEKVEVKIEEVRPKTPVVEEVKIPEPEPVKIEAVAQKIEESVPQAVTESENKPIVEEKASQPIKPIDVQNKAEGQKRDNRNGHRGYRGKGTYKPRQNREHREHREGEEGKRYNNDRRNYKPKYQEKGEDKQNETEKRANDSSSSSSSSPESRNFRKDQIKKLQDDGFIVVGKPKPKARDQRDVHDHQHGKKHHRNYHGSNK